MKTVEEALHLLRTVAIILPDEKKEIADLLEKTAAERDKAIEDLKLYFPCEACVKYKDMPEWCICDCDECLHPCPCQNCHGEKFEWRGLEEERSGNT